MIRKPGLLLLRHVSELLKREKVRRPWKVISLSYQDVIATRDELREIFGPEFARIPIRPDSAEIVHWHKCESITTTVLDWHEVLRYFGFEPLSTDLVRSRGCEEFLDLNCPVGKRHRDRYTLVIDNVVHHCFDPAQALVNIVAMTRTSGYVLHITPLAMINHGFYCLCPTLFHDFYTSNGFETVCHQTFDTTREGAAGEVREIEDPIRRIRDRSLESMQLYLGRKREETQLAIPIQTKFKNHPLSLRQDKS